MTKTLGMAMLLLVVAGWAMALDAAEPVGQPVKELKLDLGNNVPMKLVLIPAGKFLMGSPKDEAGRSDDEGFLGGQWVKEPRIEMTISKPFYLGAYDVTVDQYTQFWKDSGREDHGVLLEKPGFKQGGDHPAVCVSWDDTQAFCQWLSKKTGKTVALPT
jgi:formylglycine-generating enzyme required for sulfatase activity